MKAPKTMHYDVSNDQGRDRYRKIQEAKSSSGGDIKSTGNM
jgi:hypothetical protein